MFKKYCTVSFFPHLRKIMSECSTVYIFAYASSLVFKLTTFFIPATGDIYTKLLTFAESSRKIKVTLLWTLFVILLTSAVVYKQRLFCIEKRFCYVFKTTNAMTLTETILENNYKVLQRSWIKNRLETASEIFKGHSILCYLKRLTFVIFLLKQRIYVNYKFHLIN